MRIVDLFSGAGGLTFGFYYRVKNGGFVRNRKNSFVFANEYDKHAARAFSKNYPDIQMLNCDIKTITEEQIKELIGDDPVDIILSITSRFWMISFSYWLPTISGGTLKTMQSMN